MSKAWVYLWFKNHQHPSTLDKTIGVLPVWREDDSSLSDRLCHLSTAPLHPTCLHWWGLYPSELLHRSWRTLYTWFLSVKWCCRLWWNVKLHTKIPSHLSSYLLPRWQPDDVIDLECIWNQGQIHSSEHTWKCLENCLFFCVFRTHLTSWGSYLQSRGLDIWSSYATCSCMCWAPILYSHWHVAFKDDGSLLVELNVWN